MKKKVLIIIAIIVAIVIGVVAYFVVSDINQEEKLRTEISEIDTLIEDLNNDAIKQKLDTIVTKGDYAIVEKAYKQYLKDICNNAEKIASILEDDNITKLLTAENYKIDGPEFKITKQYITETMQILEECKNKYYDLLTEETAMSYINDKGLDSYYTDFYKQEFLTELEQERNDTTIQNSIDDLISMLQNAKKIIDFLIQNKGAWEIDGETIVFDSDSLIDEYGKLTDQL